MFKMCGIIVCGVKCSCRDSPQGCKELNNEVVENLLKLAYRRGPDKQSSHLSELEHNWKMLFAGSVLWMQGNSPVNQPLTDANNNVLLWNGDIFSGEMATGDGKCDTVTLLNQLTRTASCEESILKLLSDLRGPYSLVYWNTTTSRLYVGRDRLGRHSLLWYFEGNRKFMVTSAATRMFEFTEVPAVGLFRIKFSEDAVDVMLHPWTDITDKELSEVQAELPMPFSISSETVSSPISIKCALPHEPPPQYLDLMNQFNTPNVCQDVYNELLFSSAIAERVENLMKYLRRAVQIRCTKQPGMCRTCVLENLSEKKLNSMRVRKCKHPKIGVLFSGGLDSTIIAALAHEIVPPDEPIDLMNIAFDCGSRQILHNEKFCTPDRDTGLESSSELKTLFPNRQWNFIQIDIPTEELDKYRSEQIADLIHPHSSVLDDSLGCAVWFASRGQGMLDGCAYRSPARVLLLGMGADEQLGGYMRHRTALRHRGWLALAQEVESELARIAKRNLGRDDRVVADHGCQARFPYLDEDVVNYISSLPVWARCYPTEQMPPGMGDKLLLRLVAWKLRLSKAAMFRKRALQFGSRIANKKEKASETSLRLRRQP